MTPPWIWAPIPGVQDDSGRHYQERQHWQQVYCCSDGKWVAFSAFTQDQLSNVCVKAFGRPDILEKVKKQWPGGSYELMDWCREEMGKTFATRFFEEWVQRLLDADVPLAPVVIYVEMGDPDYIIGRHLRENGYVVEAEYPDWGMLKFVGPFMQFHGTPNKMPVNAAAPHVGQYNAEVLKELGYSAADAQRFEESGAVLKPTVYSEDAVREKRLKNRAQVEQSRKLAQAHFAAKNGIAGSSKL